ncbi:MAG: hypothetical protein JWM14_3138 [Chitinophagaceae bacterium]|nr:hypothetical protein [Chitinophagaceae bacterium]
MKHFILLFLALTLTTASFAQKKKTDSKQPAATAIVADQPRTKNFLLKTNRFTGHTHRAVFNTKKFTGDLGQMVRYERYAKKLYEEKNYQEAVYFSKRARMYGSAALAANSAIATSDGKFSAEEETITTGMPSDEELEKRITDSGSTPLTDESLMAGNLGLEIK